MNQLLAFNEENQSMRLTDLNIEDVEALEAAIDGLSDELAMKVKKLTLSQAIFLKKLPSNLGKLSGLTDLDISECHEMTNLTGIENCERLKKLDASHCLSLKDISQLSELPIEELSLSGDTQLNSLSTLEKIEITLKRLTLDGLSNLRTVNSLRKLTHLEFLSLQDTGIKSLEGLPPIPNIQFRPRL